MPKPESASTLRIFILIPRPSTLSLQFACNVSCMKGFPWNCLANTPTKDAGDWDADWLLPFLFENADICMKRGQVMCEDGVD